MAVKAYKKELSYIVNLLKEEHVRINVIKKTLKDYFRNNFNFNSKYYQGKTLLHYVIENNASCLISLLIKYGANP